MDEAPTTGVLMCTACDSPRTRAARFFAYFLRAFIFS